MTRTLSGHESRALPKRSGSKPPSRYQLEATAVISRFGPLSARCEIGFTRITGADLGPRSPLATTIVPNECPSTTESACPSVLQKRPQPATVAVRGHLTVRPRTALPETLEGPG
jgi:hypothetical protein